PHRVALTDDGIRFIEQQTGRNLSTKANEPLKRHAENALTAKWLIEKDVHYFVEDGRVVLVDTRTGHRLNDRRYHDGLAEAIEYAELVEVLGPTRVLDAMTVVDFLAEREFAGMTGTIGGEAGVAAFREHYGKGVADIRPHRPPARKDYTVTYRTAAEKWDGIFSEVVATRRTGRPVLVVTGSIRDAARFSQRLRDAGIEHNVLTARTSPAEEARILAEAGRWHQVTVATNRAGRGIDIKLGGDATPLARRIMERDHPGITPADPRYDGLVNAARIEAEGLRHDASNEAGGLHVVLTEFPESLRVEYQGRGRAGRQGENGSSTLHRSLEDPVLQPVGKGEFSATRAADDGALRVDSAAVDALFRLARQEAELAVRAERGAQRARVAVQRPSWRRGSPARGVLDAQGVPPPTQRSAVPANPAGIDLPQLALLRAGQDVPGLSAELNRELRDLAERFDVENAVTGPELEAAATIARHLPERTFQPHRYTEADLAAVNDRIAELTRQANAVGRAGELQDLLGADADQLAATAAVAAQLLAEREEAKRRGRPVEVHRGDPAERLRLASLSDRELQALLDYVAGLPEGLIAQRLGIPVGELGWFLPVPDPANPQRWTGPGVVVDKLTRATRNNPLLGTREAAGRHVRTEQRSEERR